MLWKRRDSRLRWRVAVIGIGTGFQIVTSDSNRRACSSALAYYPMIKSYSQRAYADDQSSNACKAYSYKSVYLQISSPLEHYWYPSIQNYCYWKVTHYGPIEQTPTLRNASVTSNETGFKKLAMDGEKSPGFCSNAWNRY